MNDLPAPQAKHLPELPDGWHRLTYKILSGNRLGILGVDRDFYQEAAGKTVSAKASLNNVTAKIWVFDGQALSECLSFPLTGRFPQFDQFPDGHWLVANSRSRGDGNARVLNADGKEVAQLELGDGINHLKICDKGHIWVGWFDEGIFGNENWRYPGLKWPPSSYGIVAFNTKGEVIKHPELISPADCYALNVFGNEAWSCTYTDFPIWQMTQTKEHIWPSNLSGISALAISYPYVLLAGGYGENKNRICLVKIKENKSVQLREWSASILADRQHLHLLDGRANVLHAVVGHIWYRWDVTQFMMPEYTSS